MRKNDKKTENAVLTAEELEARKTLKRKRIIAIVSLVIAIGLIVWLSVFITRSFLSVGEGEDITDAPRHFKEMIESHGIWGIFIAFGIQVLQVVVSPIPGEVIETGMGLIYGPFWGAVICLAGCALSSWLIMLFVRRFGVKFVELFISVDKINNLKFINSEKKLERFVAILYILPGTPKDPLIFFFGLTKIKISTFVLISTVARIPSIVTSTIGGHLIQDKNYLAAVILYVVVGAVSLACLLLYRKILDALKKRTDKKETPEKDKNPEESGTESTNKEETKDVSNGPDGL